jgi:hypothetical protein
MKDNIMYLIPLFALISYSQINTDNNIFTEKKK